MKRENESVDLSAKGSSYIHEDAASPLHHTTVSDTKMNGMSFETSLNTRLKFIPPTREVFVASEYFIEISVRQTIEHTLISLKKYRIKHALSGKLFSSKKAQVFQMKFVE